MKSTKSQITRESILDAISKGAKSLTQISKAHGYIGAVSGGTSARIRELVPDVATRLAGKVEPIAQPVAEPVAEQKPVVKTVKVVKAPAVVVAQKKGVYRGLYGVVFDRAVKAGEVKVHEFIPKVANEIVADPACAEAVAKIKAKVGTTDLVEAVAKAITFAIGVLRSPNHPSNLNRSRNASEKRGCVLIEAVEG